MNNMDQINLDTLQAVQLVCGDENSQSHLSVYRIGKNAYDPQRFANALTLPALILSILKFSFAQS